MKFGYARISKPGQRYDRQQKMLEEHGYSGIAVNHGYLQTPG